jgi:hypothetical protein
MVIECLQFNLRMAKSRTSEDTPGYVLEDGGENRRPINQTGETTNEKTDT